MYLATALIIGIVLIAFLAGMSNGIAAATGLVLAVLVTIVILKRNAEVTSKNKNNRSDLKIITNVGVGGVFKLANIDGYDEDLELKVMRKHMYQEGDYFWYELECIKGDGEKAWVEVEDDDNIVTSIVLNKLKISQVPGLSPEKLAHDDDEESGRITYSGKYFNYTDSGNAIFFRDCDDTKSEKLYYWDYKSGNYLFSVERWGSGDETSYEAYYCQIVKPLSITIYSLGDEGEKQ